MLAVRLTLVSASPRRKELLECAGFSFDIAPTHAREIWSSGSPRQLAEFNAEKKVRASDFFAARDRLLLSADTIIACGSQVFGKPAGPESARRMLALFSGRKHQVITGICLSGPAGDREQTLTVSASAITEVSFRALSNQDIADYIASGEWQGKAGAYGIQGIAREFISELSGDLDNVVGLPIKQIHELLAGNFKHCKF